MKLTGLSSCHVGEDPEGLGLHGGSALSPLPHVRVPPGALHGLIDRRGAVYEMIFNWETTVTTSPPTHTPPTPQSVNTETLKLQI